jgi:transposase
LKQISLARCHTGKIGAGPELYGFTREEIFDQKSRVKIRELPEDPALKFQVNRLMGRFERDEADTAVLEEQVLLRAEPFMKETNILAGMKGIGVFIAIAVIADIIDANRLKNSAQCTAYLRSVPRTASSKQARAAGGRTRRGGSSARL